jgi:hypothetical protein
LLSPRPLRIDFERSEKSAKGRRIVESVSAGPLRLDSRAQRVNQQGTGARSIPKPS